MKRIISILLSALMVIAMIPVSVFVVSAEGETVEIYNNDFKSAEAVARGTCGNESVAYNETAKALLITYPGTSWDYSKAYWETSIDLNGTDGLITLTTEIDADASQPVSGNAMRGDGAILTVNGKVIIKNITEANGDYKVSLADGTIVQKACSGNYKENITLTINPKTGKGTLVFDQTAANKKDGGFAKTTTVDIDLGTIGESITVRYGTNRHKNFYVYSLNVTQVKGNELSAEEPEVSMDTLCEVGGKEFAGWSDGTYVEQTVTTNGTDGDITIVFTPANNNWQKPGDNLLSVNGVSVISHGASKGNYVLGSTDVAADWKARVITVTIKVATGDATIVDAAGNSGTANVGPIGDTFTFKINQENTNKWTLTSLVVTQVRGTTHTCEYETVVTPASCRTPEFTAEVCTSCGKSTSTVTGPVLGHTWGEWTKNDAGASTRKCSICSTTETKTVGEIDTSKTFLALGDSLTFGYATPGTIDDSWAKEVADRLEMTKYVNKALHGSEAYQWYSVLTGNPAPNGKITTDINGFDQAAMTDAIKNAGVVAFTLGSNDMSGGYLQWRTPEQVRDAIVGFIDAIHEINHNAVVIAVGYAYGLITTDPHKDFDGSYNHFVELDKLLKETLNSGDYNSFAYYVDVSKTMSDPETQGNDHVHPKADGHIEMANDVIAAIASTGTPISEPKEEYSYFENKFDGNAKATFINWTESGTDGVLTVAPGASYTLNGGGHFALPANLIVKFDFMIPTLPESGNIYIFVDRSTLQNYITVSYDATTGKFYATVANKSSAAKVEITAGEWYSVGIAFPSSNAESSKIYIDGIYVGGITASAIGWGAKNGWFNFFGGTFNNGTQNAASYCIDNFYASTDPADLPKEKVQDTTSREESNAYVNNFDGTKPSTDGVFLKSDVVGENGVLTVAPNSDIANRFTLQDESFANAIMNFKFKIPSISEGSVMRTLFNRSTGEYWLGMSWITPEDGDPYFAAYVPNNTVKYVPIEADTWYTMTALFPSNSSGKVMLFINGTYVGEASAASMEHKNGFGFNFFGHRGGTWDTSLTNTDTYCIDDLTVYSVADKDFVKITGFQKTKVNGDKYDVRFVAAVQDLFANETAIGFDITATFGDGSTKSWLGRETSTVYNSLNAGYGKDTVTADQIGGKYVTAMAITGVPSNLDFVEFTVKPYVVINGAKIYGSAVTVTVHPEA